jgi:uncharacterized protein YukE
VYYTKAEDLARMANDLDQLARKYNEGAQELDRQTAGLDGVTQQLIAGGPDHWLGVSSDAFQGAWEERRARMQQVSQILTQSAQRFTQFAQTIEEHLPTIRADQAVQQSTAHMMLGPDDQKSILDEESQAQNAIVTALALFNSQLEQLAEEIKDCPQEQQPTNHLGHDGNVSKNDVGRDSASGEKTSESGTGDPPGGWKRVPQDEDPLPPDSSIPSYPTSNSTPEVFEADQNVASLYPDGELQIGWIDGVLDDTTSNGKRQFLQLRSLVKWLNNRVQTISGYATDAFRAKYFSTDAVSEASMQRFNVTLSKMGFVGTYEKVSNMIHITFTRIK